MKRVNALQLRQSLGKVLEELAKDGEPIMVEKGRQPAAVLISLRDFRERFHEKDAADQRDQLIARMEEIIRNATKIDPRPGLEILRELRGHED
jgi:prevent-host-death family protein